MRTSIKNLARKLVEELLEDYEQQIYLTYGDRVSNKNETIDQSTEVLIGWLESFDTDVLEDFVKAEHDENFDKLMGSDDTRYEECE